MVAPELSQMEVSTTTSPSAGMLISSAEGENIIDGKEESSIIRKIIYLPIKQLSLIHI